MDRVKFWRGKKVLITGHTGFKGTWLTIWLHRLGATVLGYALKKYPNDAFYNSTNISKKIIDVRDNIEDNRALNAVFSKYQPDMVFHLAARSLVRRSYDEPLGTFNTNILGTANVLESIRLSKSVKAAVIITSDKCYKNNEWVWGYRENDTLGGHDPYSCSKGCAEMLVDCYRRSFFKDQSKYVASARAGNVIGGGDWSEDRLIPDCIKSLEKGEKIRVHNPGSTRPWQHVLEPLDGYLTLAEKMWTKKKYDEAWNFGPTLASIRPVGDIVDLLIEKWRGGAWEHVPEGNRHEAKTLSLDITKTWINLKWNPRLTIDESMDLVVEWYKHYRGEDPYGLTLRQITGYEALTHPN